MRFKSCLAKIDPFARGHERHDKGEAMDLSMLHALSRSFASSGDYRQILESTREQIKSRVECAEVYIFADGDEERSRDLPIRTAVAVPLIFCAETHGVILVGFREKDRSLSSKELKFCELVAFAAAVALSHAKQYEALGDEVKRSKTISAELAEANRLRAEYLTNASHELRTPLAAIIGYSQIMMEGLVGPLTGKQKKSVARLLENARGLLQKVEEVLDYSKLKHGEGVLNKGRREVRSFIEELRQELAVLEKDKPYRIQYEIDEDVTWLETDWEKLKRILTNLISNAVKFTPDGEIKLSVMNGSRESVSFIVSDTGIGIPKDKTSFIFDKFRQADGSLARNYQGMGLGLTVSKNLVDLMGGNIEVESKLGKGSVFKVVVPSSH